ncbi:MAG: prephenate dehydrogenase/arogenate dehydrogenase family protein [Pirellulales bacterium]
MTADSDTANRAPAVAPRAAKAARRPWNTVAILGVGLLGGSLGLGLLERRLARRVIGIGRRVSTLRAARRRGAVTETTTDLASGVAEADLVVVCTPVSLVAQQVAEVRRHCPAGALITDVGSTKGSIVAAVESQRDRDLRGTFVGSHPMAGSEKTGVKFAAADLFVGRAVIVTPTPRTPTAAVLKTVQLWRSLGAKTTKMAAEEHDEAVAAISHLPHLAASALAASTPRGRLPLVGGGWLDTTRVAAGDVELWRQIFEDNRGRIVERLDQFMNTLAEFRRVLVDRDEPGLRRLLEAGKDIRDAVGN